jgi:hypothetical protein
MIKLAIALPAYGSHVDVGHAGMWMNFGSALSDNRETFDLVFFGSVDTNPVGDARNLCVQGGLDAGADWVLMVDADTYYRGQHDDAVNDGAGLDILRMVKDAQALGAAMVGAPVRARGWEGHEHTVWMERQAHFTVNVRLQIRALPEEFVGKIVECTRIGGAFIAINLRWLNDHMPEPPWFVHEPIMVGPRADRLKAYGEDLSFCDRVRIAGGKIFVDGRILPKHAMRGERI